MSAEQGIGQLSTAIAKTREAKRLLEEAKALVGICKVCNSEMDVLVRATDDLTTILDVAKTTIEKSEKLSGLRDLGPLSGNLSQIAGEARGSPGSDEKLLPIPRPTELLKMMTSGSHSGPRKGKFERPPMPHEVLGIELPLPGRMVREAGERR